MQSSSVKRRKSSKMDSAIPCCTDAVSLQKALNELSVYKNLFKQSSYQMSKAKVKIVELKKSLKKSLKILNEVVYSLDYDFNDSDDPRFSTTPCSCKNEMNPVSKMTDEVYAEQSLISDSENDSSQVPSKLEADNFVSQTGNVKGSMHRDTVDSKDEKKSCKIKKEKKKGKLMSKKNSLANDIPKDLESTYIIADRCESIKKMNNLKASTHLQLNVNNSEVENTAVNSKPLFSEYSRKTKCLSGAVSLHGTPFSELSLKKIKKNGEISIPSESNIDNKTEEMLIKNSKTKVDSDVTDQTVTETVEQDFPVTNAEMTSDDSQKKNAKSDIAPVNRINRKCEPESEYNDILSVEEKQLISKNLPAKMTPIRQNILKDQRRKTDGMKRKYVQKISLGENLNKNIPLDDLLPKHLRYS